MIGNAEVGMSGFLMGNNQKKVMQKDAQNRLVITVSNCDARF